MFTDPLTAEDLYWIGYIRADGSIGNDRLIFAQTIREPVQALLNYVQGQGKVGKSDQQQIFYARQEI